MGLPKRPGKIRGMKKASQNARRHLSKNSDLSTNFEDIPIEYTPMSSKCEKQSLMGGSSESGGGTITMIGYDEDDIPVVVTAHHVAENPNSAEAIKWDGHTIDDIQDYDPTEPASAYTDPLFGQDIISFYLDSIPPQEFDSDVDKALTKPEIPNIVGCWTFDGLADETSGGFINNKNYGPVYLYGHTSQKVETQIGKTVTTHEPSYLSYGAKTVDYVTEDGDSGGPWVDGDGYLCGHHVAGETDEEVGVFGDPYSIIGVADKSLKRIGVTIGVLGNNPK